MRLGIRLSVRPRTLRDNRSSSYNFQALWSVWRCRRLGVWGGDRGGGGGVLGSKVARLRQLARLTLDHGILCMGASLRESRILSSMSSTTISTQHQQSIQKLCSSLRDSSDLHNAHRGIEAPTQKQHTSTLCSICCGSES